MAKPERNIAEPVLSGHPVLLSGHPVLLSGHPVLLSGHPVLLSDRLSKSRIFFPL